MGIAGGSPGRRAGGPARTRVPFPECCRARPGCPHTGVTRCSRGCCCPSGVRAGNSRATGCREGAGTPPDVPRRAAVSCSPLPCHPGPSQSSWDNSHLQERSRHSEGQCPTTAMPQPRGAAHLALVPSYPRIHTSSEHPLLPCRDASPIATSPAPRAGRGRPEGCRKARMSSLPSLRGMIAPESP